MGSKLKAISLLVVMFVLGAASGIAWTTYALRSVTPHASFAGHHVDALKKELKLTPDQQQALQDIFDKAHERAKEINQEVAWDLADIHEDSLKSIHDVLTPEQNAAFDKLHQKSSHHGPSEKTANSPSGIHSQSIDGDVDS